MAISGHLREIREREGISRAALARATGLSEKTLQRAEAGELVSSVTQHRILNAFNKNSDRLRDYDLAELFPAEQNDGDSK
jgi:transcriptional regulator with XRE-family HTH domain